jgi:hypothetical protein
VVEEFTVAVGDKWEVVVKVGVEFNVEIVATVSAGFIPEMVVTWKVVGKVVGEFIRSSG